MATEFFSRDDLPFLARDTAGERVDWQPRRHPESPEAGLAAGLAYAQALAALARADEYEAWAAAQAALASPHWNPAGAEEAGFADGLARAAVIGWRAQAWPRALPFGTHFDPVQAEWQSLRARVVLLEAQLVALGQRPRRVAEE